MEEKNKIFNVTNLLLIILIIILISNYLKKNENPKQDVIVNIPEKTGTSGIRVIEKITQIPVEIDGTKVIVDEKYYLKYIETKDSLQKLNLYVESIKIKEYNDTIVNNDDILIESYSKTRGSLLEQKIDYKIKEKSFSYKPEYIKERPRLTLLPTLEFGIDRNNLLPNFKGGIGFQLKNGDVFSTSLDTRNNIYIGYSKSITIIK